MVWPDYDGGSIANLISSIGEACGAPDLPCVRAILLDPDEIRGATNIVLLVVDGLGLDYLRRRGKGGALLDHLRGGLTSVFLSTTACAIPTFLTGLPPQQHGLTGWHMYFDEIDRITAVLPLVPRNGPPFAFAPGELTRRLFPQNSLTKRIHRPAHILSPARIANSEFNRFHSLGATRWSYRTRDEFFAQLAQIVDLPEAKYVHAYYPTLDTLAHDHGVDSPHVAGVFRAFDEAFASFLRQVRGSGTTVIATADHGFIDAPEERLIELDAHPKLESMLLRPLCGERRVAFAYVKPGLHDAFADYVNTELAHAATLFRSEDLIAEGRFGPGVPHPKLGSRTGHFTLVMKDDWTIKQWLPGEQPYTQIGMHGGTSAAEMWVPLIVANA
ncbi:MAG: alkaline phosphatase family protein [Rhodocyclaceae bacterium]